MLHHHAPALVKCRPGLPDDVLMRAKLLQKHDLTKGPLQLSITNWQLPY